MKRCVFLLLVFVVLPCAVAAQCGQRDVSGRWEISFGKGNTPFDVDLTQSGSSITGQARTRVSNNFGFSPGDIKGQVTGDTIDFSIERNSDRATITESFHGVFGEDGRITGTALIVAIDGNLNVPWSSDRPMKCLYKTVTKLGVKHTDPAAAQGAAAFIVASPNNIPLPFGQTTGVTTLIWDGGKDHPYAELWVKIDGQDETKVLEKGKGTLQVPIAVGRTYVYILTDAGTTLATVTVRFRQ